MNDTYYNLGVQVGRVWAEHHPGKSIERANQDSLYFAYFLNLSSGPDREVIRGFMNGVTAVFNTPKKESN